MAKKKARVAKTRELEAGYKGFNPDLTCRGYQYVMGEQHTFDDEVVLCRRGFHLCLNPLNVLQYYPPAAKGWYNKFAAVAYGDLDPDSMEGDKQVTNRLRLLKELDIGKLTDTICSYLRNTKYEVKDNPLYEFALNTAEGVKTICNGRHNIAVNCAENGRAVANDGKSAAVNLTDGCMAETLHYNSAAVSAAERSVAVTHMAYSVAAVTENTSVAVTNNTHSVAVTTCESSIAMSSGPLSVSVTGGGTSAAVATGTAGAAVNMGAYGVAEVKNVSSVALNTGVNGTAIAGGKDCIAVSTGGRNSSASGVLDSGLVLAERVESGFLRVKAVLVDGKKILPNVRYVLRYDKVIAAKDGASEGNDGKRS
jgi:hypothetical protein